MSHTILLSCSVTVEFDCLTKTFISSLPQPLHSGFLRREQTASSLTRQLFLQDNREVVRGYTDQGQFDITVYDF